MLKNVAQSRWLSAYRLAKPSEEGLTLLESLVAIVVIAAVLSAVTPPIFIAVATRAQNQRAEQAMQLAQGEIDRIRTLIERAERFDLLPPATNTEVNQVTPPSSVDTSLPPGPPDPAFTSHTQAFWVDLDKNGRWNPNIDMIVQSYRGRETREASGGPPVNFQVGVRVYSGIAISNMGSLDNPAQRARLGFTTAQGGQQKRPLAVLYTFMSRNKTGVSLCKYREFLKNTSNDCGI